MLFSSQHLYRETRLFPSCHLYILSDLFTPLHRRETIKRGQTSEQEGNDEGDEKCHLPSRKQQTLRIFR